MRAVFRHELSSYFTGVTGYVFSAFLLLFTGIYTMVYNLQSASVHFEYVLGSMSFVFLIIVPILTMRVLAEERRQRTDQLLYSLPITTTQVVLGKYFALLVVYLIPLAVVSLYPLLFSQFGEVYLPTSYGSLFAFFMMGAALLAAIEAEGRKMGITNLISIITDENAASCRFHEKNGFVKEGHLHDIAVKFGRRCGVCYYRKELG